MLTPLNRLAERMGAAVVLVSHLTKAGPANGKHRVLGSIAYVGRAGRTTCSSPTLLIRPADACSWLITAATSLRRAALAYAIEDRGNGPRVEWSPEPVPSAVVDVVRPRLLAVRGREPDRSLPCDDWLGAFLSEGHRSSTAVLEAAQAAGFSRNQVRRAKNRIGAVTRKAGYARDGEWTWTLDTDEGTA